MFISISLIPKVCSEQALFDAMDKKREKLHGELEKNWITNPNSGIMRNEYIG